MTQLQKPDGQAIRRRREGGAFRRQGPPHQDATMRVSCQSSFLDEFNNSNQIRAWLGLPPRRRFKIAPRDSFGISSSCFCLSSSRNLRHRCVSGQTRGVTSP
eukprot:3319197-Rhodomonas_salina.1